MKALSQLFYNLTLLILFQDIVIFLEAQKKKSDRLC